MINVTSDLKNGEVMVIFNSYLIEPKRIEFGWSRYIEAFKTFVIKTGTNKSLVSRTEIEGKKLCLFKKYIWDYKLKVINYNEKR